MTKVSAAAVITRAENVLNERASKPGEAQARRR
jgi:hypothetical protein